MGSECGWESQCGNKTLRGSQGLREEVRHDGVLRSRANVEGVAEGVQVLDRRPSLSPFLKAMVRAGGLGRLVRRDWVSACSSKSRPGITGSSSPRC